MRWSPDFMARCSLYLRLMTAGTIVWTSPTGRTYITRPAGACYFRRRAYPQANWLLPQRNLERPATSAS